MTEAKWERGFTLIEVVVTMVILATGLLGLAPLMISVIRGNQFAKEMTIATALAEDRLEEILENPNYSRITETNFPDETEGQIYQGDPEYTKFARSVTVVDSLDAWGQSAMKNVTVSIVWSGYGGVSHSVVLYGRVSRF